MRIALIHALRHSIDPINAAGGRGTDAGSEIFSYHICPCQIAQVSTIPHNNPLEPMRLSYQKVDRVAGYSTDVRRYLEADNGRPKRSYREAYDRATSPVMGEELHLLLR